jgi:diguanylate cyclase (GGDEF)-like protein
LLQPSRKISVSIWEKTVARLLYALHIDSIRNQTLVCTVLATLIPALATTCISYKQTRRLLDDRVINELQGTSSEAARVSGLWLSERLDALRAAASSYVVSENLAKLPGRGAARALGRLRDYLNSIRERSPDHEALAIIDARGRVVTSSPRAGSVRLPPEGLSKLRTGDALVGDAYWDTGLGKAAIVLAIPVRRPDGRFLAAFAAKINLDAVAERLQRLAPNAAFDVYLITDRGKLIVSSRSSSPELMQTSLPESTTSALLMGEGRPMVYQRADGRKIVGTLRQVPQLRWAAVAEMPQAVARRPVARLWNRTALMLVALCGGVALLVYVLGLLIVRPLRRLTATATQVAAGDLSIDLPEGGAGEIGYLTQLFNTLVARLRERESQAEMERLAVTDALTGLHNRRHLMGTITTEVQRSRRLRRPFSVLLADVDRFKSYNDTHGYQAGDVALTRIADILRQMTRGVDCVARYGDEEFLVMLLETTEATALAVAERIRARVAGEEIAGGKLTISIGVAEYPAHGDTPQTLIASADAALNRAKGGGRNRVVTAGGTHESEKGRRRGGA